MAAVGPFSAAIWAAAAYRSDNDPMIVRALNDVGFFLFNLTYSATSLQAISAGIVGLCDKSATPVFPRWVGAWDGLVTFWIGFLVWFVWAASMGGSMIKDTRRRMQAQLGDPSFQDVPVTAAL